MATGIQNYPNIAAVDAAHPNGNIKDRAGATNGTPVNKLVYADVHQFFAKLLRIAGIAANNTPDNETNGFQYIEALKKVTNSGNQDAWHYVGATGEPAFQGSYSNQDATKRLRFRKDLQGNVTITGTVLITGAGSPTIFIIPSQYLPSEEFNGALIDGVDGVALSNRFLFRPIVRTNGEVGIVSAFSGGATPASIIVWIDIKYNIKS